MTRYMCDELKNTLTATEEATEAAAAETATTEPGENKGQTHGKLGARRLHLHQHRHILGADLFSQFQAD
jgi:hypothetical protein